MKRRLKRVAEEVEEQAEEVAETLLDALPNAAVSDNGSLEVTTEWLREIVAPGSGEAAFAALDGNAPVGVCLLVACDLEARAELTPWVSGFYVLPDRRRRSIGTRLLQPVIETAKGHGAAKLYLYTHTAESLYRRLGWHVMERFPLDGTDFALMVKALG